MDTEGGLGVAGNRFRLSDDQHEHNESCQRCDRPEREDPTSSEGATPRKDRRRNNPAPLDGAEAPPRFGVQVIPAAPEINAWLFHCRKLIEAKSVYAWFTALIRCNNYIDFHGPTRSQH